MKTRMEKYQDELKSSSRVNKNQEVYDTMYDNLYEEAAYSNVTVLDNSSELDVSKIKDMLNERENYKTVKRYKDVIDIKLEPKVTKTRQLLDEYEEKEYDINKILDVAKSKRDVLDTNRERSKAYQHKYVTLDNPAVDNTALDNRTKEIYQDLVNEETALLDLINTISINKKKIEEGLLDDLKGDTETSVLPPQKDSVSLDTKDDSDMFDNSLNFTKKDFEEFKDLSVTVKKNNNLIKFLVYILIIGLVVAGYFVVKHFFL